MRFKKKIGGSYQQCQIHKDVQLFRELIFEFNYKYATSDLPEKCHCKLEMKPLLQQIGESRLIIHNVCPQKRC